MQDEETQQDLESSVAGPTDTLAPPPSASPRRRNGKIEFLIYILYLFAEDDEQSKDPSFVFLS